MSGRPVHRGAAAALLLLAGAAAQAPEWTGCAAVRVEVPTRVFVGEAFPVRVVVEIERAALQQHAVQLFRQPLDVPVQVVAPWLDGGGSSGLLRVGADAPSPAAPPPAAPSLVVNGGLGRAGRGADRVRDGRAFAVVTVERRLRALAPGRLELAAPRLRLAFASAFRDDLLQGRVPVDRHDVTIDGAAVAVDVLALPAEGQPAGFSGAVGDFAATASAAPTALAVGERLELQLVVRGDGDLLAFAPPPLTVPGFHVLGVLDRGGAAARTLVYDLELLADVAALPAIEVPFFDPRDGGRYRVAATAPIPLQVRPAAVPAGGREASVPAGADGVGNGAVDGAADLADIHGGAALPRDRRAGCGDVVVAVGLVLPWLCAVAAFAWRTRRPHAGVAARTLRELALAFAAAAERRDPDLAAHYEAFLAACLPDGAADGIDLADRLLRRGVPGDLAARAARLRQSLAAARYAGLSAGAAAAAHDVVAELERALAARGGRA